MTQNQVAAPRKTRDLHNHHMDSTLWDNFDFRGDDVVVATYAKSGTTWTQQIVGQLVHQGDASINIHDLSPWWDLRVIPPEARQAFAGQTHRRVVKTHLPADALVMSPKAKYVYIARDGRDVVWSLYNHHSNFKDMAYELFNNTPGLVGEPLPRADPDIVQYFQTWLARDGYPFWSLWENISTWWALRDQPNVKLLHFNQLKANLPGEMRALADFLEIDVPQDKWPAIIEHCTFDYMKANAELCAPMGGIAWEGGAGTFINKGTNGRWHDALSAEDIAAYETIAVTKLGPDCARWLATGDKL
jgi:aryl sulfotransferase